MKKFLRAISLLLTVTSLILVASCSKEEEKKPDPTDSLPNKVCIEVRDFGLITVELYPDLAPVTVRNFKKLVSEKFYDGLTFHRIMSGFMIQGGDPEGNGTGGSGERIIGEFSENGIENPIKHERGTISMARVKLPNSASSQFFIVHETSAKNTLSLDGKYAAFGKVTEGIEVVDKIASVETGTNDKPLTDVVMEKVYFVEN